MIDTYYIDSLTGLVHFLSANDLGIIESGKFPNPIAPTWSVITQEQAQAATSPEPTLIQAKIAQKLLIETSCASAITNGISSSALGAAHTYPSGQVDQLNLTAIVVRSMLPGYTASKFKTLDAGWLDHTALQIQQVGIDVEAFIATQLQKSAILQAEIDAATTSAAVQAIVW